MEKQIIITSDGSHSVYLPDMDEHYHSTHGAIAESKHIFVKNGLLAVAENFEGIKIIEVGMGTGLNVLTTFQTALMHKLDVEMHTIEAFPIGWMNLSQLNFTSQLGMESSIFKKIHQSAWNEKIQLSPNFSLHKYQVKLQEFNFDESRFNLIYFDAFAPEKQEEMWSESIFENLYKALDKNGVLVTYCVKGEVRRRLQKIGYSIEKLPGPIGGKREMMRALKRS